MTKSEAARLLAVISEAWRGVEVPETKIAIWAEMLADVPLDIALRAVKYLIATGSRFPPAIAEIRQAIIEINSPEVYQINALQSWHEALVVTENYGRAEGMEKLSPLTREVVEALGWEEIQNGDRDVIRGHFLKFFAMAKERWLKEQLLPADMKPAQFKLPEPPRRKPVQLLPPMSEEEAQAKRRRFLDAVGTMTRELEEKMKIKEAK
jgi:hypothetical protein